MKELERCGTTVDGMEWKIDLERKRLISIENPKLVKRLSKVDIKRIRELRGERAANKKSIRST